MKIKKIILSSVFALTVSTAHAQGIPVHDNANLVEAIQDAIQQTKIHLENVKQFSQMVKSYKQAVENARAKANIDNLLELVSLKEELINSNLAQSVFKEVYGLDPDSPLYKNQRDILLDKKFNLPESSTVTKTELGKYLSKDDIDRYLKDRSHVDKANASFKEGAGALTTQIEKIKETEKRYRTKVQPTAPTGDDSLNASVQHGNLQNDVQIKLKLQELELKRMEMELELERESRLLAAQKRQEEMFQENLKAKQKILNGKLPSFTPSSLQ